MDSSTFNCEAKLFCKPRDGPALEFIPDPLLDKSIDFVTGQTTPKMQCFGLGLVAGWPVWKPSIESSYSQFIEKVSLHFTFLFFMIYCIYSNFCRSNNALTSMTFRVQRFISTLSSRFMSL